MRGRKKSISLKGLLTNLPAFTQVVSMSTSQVPYSKIKKFVEDNYGQRIFSSSLSLLKRKIMIAQKLKISVISVIKGNYAGTSLKLEYISPLEACLDAISYIDLKIKTQTVNNTDMRVLIKLLDVYRKNGRATLS